MSSAATVSRNSGRITAGSVGCFKCERRQMRKAIKPEPPTMMTGGTPILVYPKNIAVMRKAKAARLFQRRAAGLVTRGW